MMKTHKNKLLDITIDFETYYNTKEKYDLKHISMVEYIKDPRFYIQGMGIKFGKDETKWVSGKDVGTVLSLIDWTKARVIAHNVKFDGAILSWHFGINPKEWVDTKGMVKAVLGPTIPSASLKTVAQFLKLPQKGELKTNGLKELTKKQERELATYCIRDVDICYDIYKKILFQFPASQWIFLDWITRIFLSPKLEIDKDICKMISRKINTDKSNLFAIIGKDKKVFASNQQFAELLQKNGFQVPKKLNSKGKEIAALSLQDKEFLQMLDSSNNQLKALCQARVASKSVLEEKRSEKLIQISDISKYCFDLNFSGATQTHRFSGGNGCAGNPQNFTKGSDIRAAIKSPFNHTLIVADFKNIELRILAFLSKDKSLMEAIKNKEDIYSQFASKIYGRTITNKNKKERALGKAAVLGLGYGMGKERFKSTVYNQTGETLNDNFAQNVIDLYRQTYISVPQFWKVCDDLLEQINEDIDRPFSHAPFLRLQKHKIILPSGLEIKYPDLSYKCIKWFGKSKKEWLYQKYKSQKTKKDIVKIYGGMVTENLCQALAGEICKESIKRLIEYGYAPVGQVHDELLLVCPEEKELLVKDLVEDAMTAPMSWWPELPLEVEIGSGKNWLKAK